MKFDWLNTYEDFKMIGEGVVFYKDKKLSSPETRGLQEDAANFRNSFIWNFLKSELRKHAVLELYNADNNDKRNHAKAMLTNLDILQQTLDTIANLKFPT